LRPDGIADPLKHTVIAGGEDIRADRGKPYDLFSVGAVRRCPLRVGVGGKKAKEKKKNERASTSHENGAKAISVIRPEFDWPYHSSEFRTNMFPVAGRLHPR
jgi:hypothetical protein